MPDTRHPRQTLPSDIADDTGTEEEALRLEIGRLRTLVDRQDLLLRELDHRVRSGPATLMAQIAEDIRTARDPVLKAAWEQVLSRLEGLRRAQDALHRDETGRTGQPGRTDILAALRELTAALAQAHDAAQRGIAVAVRGMPIPIPSEEAALLLPICNELIGNALRYAFRGRPHGGQVDVLVRDVDGAPEVSVQDDGVGISDRTLRTGGAGLWLVRALARRLHANLTIERRGGTRVTVTLPPTG